MGHANLHYNLEQRLKVLRDRIALLRLKTARAEGFDRITAVGEIDHLERRQRELEARFQELAGEGHGFRQDVEDDIENLSEDLLGALDDLIIRLDRASSLADAPAPISRT